jgi:hypothetical protein
VSEHDRRVLHQALVDSIGEREADVLMDLLPSQDWNDFVRRGELEQLGSTLRLEMQAMESRLRLETQRMAAGFHRDMVRQTWILAGTLLAGMGALGGLLH